MPDYLHTSDVVAGRGATVSWHRPGARNGYTPHLADELAEAFQTEGADESVRVAVFTGEGPDRRVFARRGSYPEGVSTWFLPRIVGPDDLPDHLPWLGGRESRP